MSQDKEKSNEETKKEKNLRKQVEIEIKFIEDSSIRVVNVDKDNWLWELDEKTNILNSKNQFKFRDENNKIWYENPKDWKKLINSEKIIIELKFECVIKYLDEILKNISENSFSFLVLQIEDLEHSEIMLESFKKRSFSSDEIFIITKYPDENFVDNNELRYLRRCIDYRNMIKNIRNMLKIKEGNDDYSEFKFPSIKDDHNKMKDFILIQYKDYTFEYFEEGGCKQKYVKKFYWKVLNVEYGDVEGDIKEILQNGSRDHHDEKCLPLDYDKSEVCGSEYDADKMCMEDFCLKNIQNFQQSYPSEMTLLHKKLFFQGIIKLFDGHIHGPFQEIKDLGSLAALYKDRQVKTLITEVICNTIGEFWNRAANERNVFGINDLVSIDILESYITQPCLVLSYSIAKLRQ